jgi:hypothetical protein
LIGVEDVVELGEIPACCAKLPLKRIALAAEIAAEAFGLEPLHKVLVVLVCGWVEAVVPGLAAPGGGGAAADVCQERGERVGPCCWWCS